MGRQGVGGHMHEMEATTTKELNKAFGGRLQQMRLQGDMTTAQVAQAIGVSRQALWTWESGQDMPSVVTVVKLANLFGVSLDWLLRGPAIKHTVPASSD